MRVLATLAIVFGLFGLVVSSMLLIAPIVLRPAEVQAMEISPGLVGGAGAALALTLILGGWVTLAVTRKR